MLARQEVLMVRGVWAVMGLCGIRFIGLNLISFCENKQKQLIESIQSHNTREGKTCPYYNAKAILAPPALSPVAIQMINFLQHLSYE